jgi:hypothetical protein
VYAIGSSTMASLLGPALERDLRREGIEVRTWGKSSSGLARPDFHDWPSKIPNIVRRHRPDLFVVSLGTNDFQPLRQGRGWIRFENPRWQQTYRDRVDRMLDMMSGPERRRAVIWVGPTSFPGDNVRRYGPVITRILRERIEAFGGPAFYVDAFAATSNEQGLPRNTLTIPGRRQPLPLRGNDNIHLTMAAVRAVMVEPVVQRLTSCLRGVHDEP